MLKFISRAALAGTVGFVIYLAATGVTLRDCGRWVERQSGVTLQAEMREVPHTGYSPVVPVR